MCSYLIYGVIILAVCGFISVCCYEECSSATDTVLIQSSCKRENDDLMHAHLSEDYLDVCRKMAVMLKCAFMNLPRCYDYFESTTFGMYFHSPYSCELSEQQVREFQEIHNRGTRVDVTPTVSSTPNTESMTSTTSSTTTAQSGEVTVNATSTSSSTTTEERTTKGGGTAGGRMVGQEGGEVGNSEERIRISSYNAASLTLFSTCHVVMFGLGLWALSWILTS